MGNIMDNIIVRQSNFSNWFDVRINGKLHTNTRTKEEGERLADTLRGGKRRAKKRIKDAV